MAAMQAMLNSMTPEQRAQLAGPRRSSSSRTWTSRWQMDQLGENLQQLFPQMGWERSYDFSGQDPLGFAEASADAERARRPRPAREPAARARRAPVRWPRSTSTGPASCSATTRPRSLEELAELAKMLEEAGLIENSEGRSSSRPRACAGSASNALSDLFSKLAKDKLGRHEIERTGIGHERTYDTKPYEFGDPFNLHIERTVRNAVRRTGGGTPVRLTPDDFEIEQTEQTVRSSTVLMLDLSLSMPMRDNFLAAKKVAMALHSLISSSSPGTTSASSASARWPACSSPSSCPRSSWDFVYGTNMQHGLRLARQLLAREHGHQADHHDHRRRAHGPHRGRDGGAVLQLPAGAGDGRRHAARGAALHPRRHPHQHLHARRHAVPASTSSRSSRR